jgi:hypothetical protein
MVDSDSTPPGETLPPEAAGKKSRGKSDRPDPVTWTRAICPPTATRGEIGRLTNRSVSYVNKKVASGAYKVVGGDRRGDIWTRSVWDDLESRVTTDTKAQPRPGKVRGGPGRKPKPAPKTGRKSKSKSKPAAEAAQS